MRATSHLFASKLRELLHHPLVDLALEGNDERGQLSEALPAPRREFRLVTSRVIDVDLAVIAGEAHREPPLCLSAIFALPGLADDLARDVVGEPVPHLGQLFHRADIGLLVQLAPRGRPWLLPRVDAALWHLPGIGLIDVLRAAEALADKDAAGAVEHHDTDARPIGQGFERGHRYVLLSDQVSRRDACCGPAKGPTR